VTKVLWASFVQLFDDYGDVLAGGTIDSYAGGTSTPKATYTDSTGGSANANPIVLNSAGRDDGGIWVNKGEAYKFVLKNSSGSTIDTIDQVVVGEVATSETRQLLISMTYCATPGAQAFMGAAEILNTATLPVDFDGASGSVQTSPGSDYVISVHLNGVECGTVTIASTGVFTFATTGGATVPLAFGDTLSFHAPSSVGTAADFAITLVAALA
jgi:hypothetical protein